MFQILKPKKLQIWLVHSKSVYRFKTQKVTDMSYKFKGLRYIDYIDVSSFDTKEVVNMSSMFEDCNIWILSTSNFNK